MEGIYVTYPLFPRDASFEAKFELLNLLLSLSDKFEFLKNADRYIIMNPSGYKGIIIVDLRDVLKETNEDFKESLSYEIMKKYNDLKQSGFIKNITKLVILDYLVSTDYESIKNAVSRFRDKIKGKWRLTVKTRKWRFIDRNKLILKAAELIDKPVDLESPEFEVVIQIFGELTGIYLVEHSTR